MTEELNISENSTNQENQKVEQVKTSFHTREITNKSVATPNTDDFNWDELGKSKLPYSESERKAMEEQYNQSFNAIEEQKVIDGTVVAKNAREVVVNIGFKSDGVIPANELRYLPDLKIGDTVEVYVESQEDANGQLSLIAIERTLVLSGLTENADIYVYDMNGKQITGTHTAGDNGVWRTIVPATGVYFVRVNSANSQQTLRTIVK